MGVTKTSQPRPERLYGLPGAEILWDSPAKLFENDIWPWVDSRMPGESKRQAWTVEEWTVCDPADRKHSGDPKWTVEHVAERFADDWWDDPFGGTQPVNDERCLELARQLHEAVAALVTRHQAEDRVALHVLTTDDTGVPYFNGEPLVFDDEPIGEVD